MNVRRFGASQISVKGQCYQTNARSFSSLQSSLGIIFQVTETGAICVVIIYRDFVLGKRHQVLPMLNVLLAFPTLRVLLSEHLYSIILVGGT